MITLYRMGNHRNLMVTELSGKSTDVKPINVENGSSFIEIDTGKTYRFDAENKVWHEGVIE